MERLTPLQRKARIALDDEQVHQDAAVLTEPVRKPPKINQFSRVIRRAAKIRMRKTVEYLVDHNRPDDLTDFQAAMVSHFHPLMYRPLPYRHRVRL